MFNRGIWLCWNGKYGGSGPTSVWDIEHGARPTRTRRAVPGGDTTGRAACQVIEIELWSIYRWLMQRTVFDSTLAAILSYEATG